MAKELPFFKFEPNEWGSGMIQLCSFESKGLFIEICCLYWSRLGNLPYAFALQKLCMGNAALLKELENNSVFKVENDIIVINFLDDQLEKFQNTREERRNAANKRWKDAKAMQMHSKSNAIREEKIRVDKSIEDRKRSFYNSLLPYLKTYEQDTLRDFYDYWTEHGSKDKKFRAEKEKSFSIERRLRTWKKNENKFSPSTNDQPKKIWV